MLRLFFHCCSTCEQRFTQCDLCYHFKDAINNAANLEEKLGALVKYREHLSSQYADRTIQWGLQELAVDPMSNLIVMQIDGMDQAKYKIPRDPKLKATASVILELCHYMFVVFLVMNFYFNTVLNLVNPPGKFKCDIFGTWLKLRPSAKRPKMKVHGLWIFGYSLELRVMDETLRYDSSCITELIVAWQKKLQTCLYAFLV